MRGTVLETCSLEKIFICRCKNIRNRTPYGVGGEAGEAAPPTLATEGGCGPECLSRRTLMLAGSAEGVSSDVLQKLTGSCSIASNVPGFAAARARHEDDREELRDRPKNI